MYIPHSLYSGLLLLAVLMGSGCSKNDPSDPNSSEGKTAISLAPVNTVPTINMGHDPDEKFKATHTTINSFQRSNTYNNYGFAYVYERRSGDGQVHYYKSIQEFVLDNFTNHKNILAETWVEISDTEWQQSEQHYKQSGELIDLEPEILQATGIYLKRQQFLAQQQQRQQQFEHERAEFDARFKQRKAEFDANFAQQHAEITAKASQKQNHRPEATAESADQLADEAQHEASTTPSVATNPKPDSDSVHHPAPEPVAEDDAIYL